MIRLSLAAAALALVAAMPAAQTPATYDVMFVVDGQQFTGKTSFAVDRTGAVSGDLKIDQPEAVTATLAGAIKDGTWTFEYKYSMPARGCTGNIKGTAKVPADRKEISGTATIGGGCTEAPLEASFAFVRK